MTRHGSYHNLDSEETSVVSTRADTKKPTMRTSLKHLQNDDADLSPEDEVEEHEGHREQRQDTNIVSPQKASVRAMAQQFEKSVAIREEQRRQSLSVGSPIAERKKLLQKSLTLPRDEASDEVGQASSPSRDDSLYEKKSLLKSRRGKTIAASRRNKQASWVADRMKMFEKKPGTSPAAAGVGTATNARTTASTVQDGFNEDASAFSADFTTMSAPTVFVLATPIHELHQQRQQEGAVTPAVSESENSTLDYSIFSDDTFNVKDEIENMKRLQESGTRGTLPTSVAEENEVSRMNSNLSPTNCFNNTLHDIVRSFEKDSSTLLSPRETRDGPEHREGGEGHGSTRIYVTESRRAKSTSPVSMPSLASRDTVRSAAYIDKSQGVEEQEDEIMVPFDEPTQDREEMEPSLKKDPGKFVPSPSSPNSSLFSTVEQEEDREARDVDEEEGTESLLDAVEPQEDQEDDKPKKDDANASHDFHELASLFNDLDQDEEPEGSNDGDIDDKANRDAPARSGWQSDSDEGDSLFKSGGQFSYSVDEDDGPKKQHCDRERHAHKKNSVNNDKAAAPLRRYEIASEKEPAIKGILKNKMEPVTPFIGPKPASPTSSATSWYSGSTNSIATSDISQQAPPEHSSYLSMPILPLKVSGSRKTSIGARVNAHLAENPPEGASEVSSQCSSFRAHQNESVNSASIWPHRLERRDSASSSLLSRSLRSQTGSPTSMDPQCSKSQQEHQHNFGEVAQAATTMAKTASTVVLDVLVDTADKVVVSPLLSLFNCVDQSEGILCQGATLEDCWGAALGQSAAIKKKRGRRKLTKRHQRRFKS